MRDVEWVEIGAPVKTAPKPKPTPTPEQIAREAERKAEAEHYRLAHRQRIKERIEAARRAEIEYIDGTEELSQIDNAKEMAAAEHVARCAPLQAELAEIDRQYPLAEQKTRRRELVDSIRKLNADLETQIAALDKQYAIVWEARRQAGLKTVDLALARELIELGSPDLLLELRLAQRQIRPAAARVASIKHEIDSFGSRSFGSLDFLRAELAAAERERDRAEAQVEQAYRAIIEE